MIFKVSNPYLKISVLVLLLVVKQATTQINQLIDYQSPDEQQSLIQATTQVDQLSNVYSPDEQQSATQNIGAEDKLRSFSDPFDAGLFLFNVSSGEDIFRVNDYANVLITQPDLLELFDSVLSNYRCEDFKNLLTSMGCLLKNVSTSSRNNYYDAIDQYQYIDSCLPSKTEIDTEVSDDECQRFKISTPILGVPESCNAIPGPYDCESTKWFKQSNCKCKQYRTCGNVGFAKKSDCESECCD